MATLDWLIILAYFLALAGLTWWVLHNNKDTAEDYFLAGRSIGPVVFLLSLFGVNLGLRDTGGAISMLAVVFSLIGATLAVLNLVLDFDYIEQGVAMGAPASESWRGAFGLTVTMVWLYIEILRLLSYIRR